MTLPVGEGLDEVFGREVVVAQPIGVGVDDDGAGVRTERSCADRAGDFGLQKRADPLLGEVGEHPQRVLF